MARKRSSRKPSVPPPPAAPAAASEAQPATTQPSRARPAPPGRRRRRGAPSTPPWSTIAAVAGVALAALVAFSNAMPAATVHDDAFFVPARYKVTWSSVAQMFREDTWSSAGTPQGTYRPLSILSIAVNGEMFGSDPVGYHATNVVLHAGASLLVMLLAWQLVGSVPAAALAAALFAVHPIHTEAVASVFNRSEILATLATLGALAMVAAWHERRPVAAWGGAAVLYLVGLLCRESAVTLPALAVLLVWFAGGGRDARSRLALAAPALVLLLPLAEYFVLRSSALATQVQGNGPALGVDTTTSLGGLVAYSLATLREYARMLAWPWPLRMSYENFAGDGLVASLAVHAALVGAAVALRRRAPVVSYAVAFFYVALAPSTRLATSLGAALGIGEASGMKLQNSLLLGERVAYLPSVGLALALAAGLAAVERRRGIVAAAAACAVLLVPATALTRHRNFQWHSPAVLFAAEVEADPENGDAWRLYVSAMQSAGRTDDAVRACDGQLARGGRSAQLFNNCGVVYDKVGRADSAMEAYRRAIDQGLAAVGHANLGRVYARLGRAAEAEAEFVAAAEAETDPAQRHYRTGMMLARFHPERAADARREFEEALRLQPGFAAARQALAQLPR